MNSSSPAPSPQSPVPLRTPEFLLWSIEFTCPIRSFEDGTIPERVERQLRGARSFGEALREGRVFEGLAIDPPSGFRVDVALAIYGGTGAVQACCRDCPVNALAESSPLAGCYGYVRLPADSAPVHTAIDAAVEAANIPPLWPAEWEDVRPRWFGLWAQPLHGAQLLGARRVLEAAQIEDATCRQGIELLKRGLSTAHRAARTLHVRAFPAGRVENGIWRLMPHCPRCKGAWGEPTSRRCGVCGYEGAPAPDKKRLARGQRPYFPLDRLLGPRQAAELLVRYEESKRRPEAGDRG